MAKIGIGFFCFGDEYYFEGAKEKIHNFLDKDFACYVLTDNPTFFSKEFYKSISIIPYYRQFKSYHDKLILVKHMIKNNDSFFLLDSDTDIIDESLYDDLAKYKFNFGITYFDILKNHPLDKQYTGEIEMHHTEWLKYYDYIRRVYPDYKNLELIWEYLIAFNRNGFNMESFFIQYEKLQLVREYCYLNLTKEIKANGEGISIQISSRLTETQIQRDVEFYEKIKNKIKSVSKKFK